MNYDNVKAILSKPVKTVITSHSRPDGDALGSSLAMYLYLTNKGFDCTVIMPTIYAEFLQWLPANDKVLIYERKKEEAKKATDEAELVFCLDFNDLRRTEPYNTLLEESTAPKILIDHHIDPQDFAVETLSKTIASSTCELVFDFIKEIDGEEAITKDIATCLYTGLLTDTGRFKHSTTAHVFEVASGLISKDIDAQFINEKVFDSFNERRLRFFGYCFSKKMKVFKEIGFAYIAVSTEELKRFNIQAGDTEGLVNFPLSLSNVNMAVLVKEDHDRVKMSFRSKGEVSVADFAKKYFAGGGHKNASGGRSFKPYQTVLQELEKFANEFLTAEDS